MLREDRKLLEEVLQGEVSQILNKELWIWGAGNTAVLFYEGLRRLEEEGFKIAGFCDSSEQMQGRLFAERWKIVAPEELQGRDNVFVLICTIRMDVADAIRKQMEKLSLQGCLLDTLILRWQKEAVMQCYDLLEDDKSKEIYSGIIRCRVNGEKVKPEYVSDMPYFELVRFRRAEQEVFVDCGAYTGDTLETYFQVAKGTVKKYIAFEPDEKNYKKLEQTAAMIVRENNLSEDTITTLKFGVGDKMERLSFETYDEDGRKGSKFTLNQTDGNCAVVALDDFLEEPYTFLKADIESYEYKMLLGAQKGIKRYRPKIAVCIYHNVVDMYSIILLLKSFVPEYRFAIRHYMEEMAETVLYAWVDSYEG